MHIKKLRFYARHTPIPKMLKTTENKIISYSAKRLRDKYPAIVKDYMSEVHEEHDRLMKAYSMNKLLKPLADDFVPPRDDFQFKRLGRTENYENFLKNRAKIEANLMVLYPFVRCIHYYSNIDFPLILINFSKYRAAGELGIHDLRDFTKKDLNENSAFIKKTWYPKIVKIMCSHYGKQNKYRLTRKQWQKAWNCATGLIVRQINDLKMRTIEHLNDVILNSTKIPFLKIIAICEDQIDLCPTIEEIFEMYHSFIGELMMDLNEIVEWRFENTSSRSWEAYVWDGRWSINEMGGKSNPHFLHDVIFEGLFKETIKFSAKSFALTFRRASTPLLKFDLMCRRSLELHCTM